MRKKLLFIFIPVICIVAVAVIFFAKTRMAFPEVWSSNGFNGPTFEYKTNCVSLGDVEELKDCFLSSVTHVVVITPQGDEVELEKDFNINEYSGEVTRRWVIYGPPGEGIPAPGVYRFIYYKDGEIALEQKVDYKPETIGYPTNVTWRKDGEDILVSWVPPEGVRSGMWYKVLIFRDEGNLISQVEEWDVESARLKNIPLNAGETGQLNVAVYFRGGFADSEPVEVRW